MFVNKKVMYPWAALAAAIATNEVQAHHEVPVEEVVVFGRAEQLIGQASAASEGSVGGDDLLVRPMLRVADLLESVPGMIAAQHSGSGKANQYFFARLSVGSRNRLHHLCRRCALEPSHARTWTGLS